MLAARIRDYAILSAVLTALAASPGFAAEVFTKLDGAWKGSGVVKLQGGVERITCRGYYNAKGGDALSIAIRCASPSYRIEMRSNVRESGGRLTGSWEERTFNAEGALSGRVSSSAINLAISGVIKGSMSISVGGGGHQVNLTASGPRFLGVSISMSRS